MSGKDSCVVVLGASPKPSRYSNLAVRLLKSQGYRVIPVHPWAETIEDLPVLHALGAITEPVDTLTLYVGGQREKGLIDDIVGLKPGRVILNPGTGCWELEQALTEHGIPFIYGCTLVMLRSGKF